MYKAVLNGNMQNIIDFNKSININWEKQGKHIICSKYYIEGKSILTADPERIIKLHAGNGKKYITNNGSYKNKESFIHNKIIGIWKNEQGKQSKTNRGTIHYSKTGAHIVPSMPISKLPLEEEQN